MAPALPFIQAGASIAGGVASGKGGKGAQKKMSQLYEQQLSMMRPLIENLRQGQEFSLGQAKSSMQTAQGQGQQVGDFWSGILKGGPRANEYLAPVMKQITRGYDSAIGNLMRQSVRGSLGDRMVDMQFKKIGDMAQARYGALGDAAQGLQGSANFFGNMGIGSMNAATGAGSAPLGPLASTANNALSQYGNMSQGANPGGTAGGIFNLIGNISGMLGKSGGGFNSASDKSAWGTPGYDPLPGLK